MSYQTVASFSQVVSLLMFIGMFAAVLAYALWPSNGPRFERIQRQALDLDRKTPPQDGMDDRGAK
jgi:cytochrome c oxidase cbb3-type subunit 4